MYFKHFPLDLTLATFTYPSGQETVAGIMVAPLGDGPFPVVIYNRGGNRFYGALTPQTVTGFFSDLAGAGYLVLASQYRGGPGSTGSDEFGGADVNDVLNLLPIVDSLPNADAKRIGMVGVSRGGMMTYLALTKIDRIKAAVTVGGIFDLVRNAKQRPGMAGVFKECFGGGDVELHLRSAIYQPIRVVTPMLLLHGSEDDRVDPTDATELAAKLPNAKAVIVAGGNHGLTNRWDVRMRETLGWFRQYL